MKIFSCHQNTNYEKILQNVDDVIVFLHWCEAGTYYPIESVNKNSWLNSLYKIFINAKIKDYDKIWYINSDANLIKNYNLLADVLGFEKEINVVSMPFYFLWKSKINLQLIEKNTESDVKFNVISMCRLPKFARLKIISEFYKHENFCYSMCMENFREFENFDNLFTEKKIINEIQYEGRFFKIRFSNNECLNVTAEDVLGNVSINGLDASSKVYLTEKKDELKKGSEYFGDEVPLEYHRSCIDLIGESFVDGRSIQITEKTVKPLVYKKPFIAIAGKGYHKFLQKHGFELYDELFDYDFDDIEEAPKRIIAIEKNIKKILKIKPTTLKSKIGLIKDKLHHNFENFIKIKHKNPIETNNDVFYMFLKNNFVSKCYLNEKSHKFEFEI